MLSPKSCLLFNHEKKLTEMYYGMLSTTSPISPKANALQQKLNSYYKKLMNQPEFFEDVPDSLDELAEIRAIENAWNLHLEGRISQALPKSKDEFRSWYLSIKENYNVLAKPFFDYFSQKASLEELALYLIFEQQIDGSFDDIVSLAQVGMQAKPKMILAENYWDEMGNGNEQDVHTKMFSESVDYLASFFKAVHPHLDIKSTIPTAALANGNMLLMYANRRKYIPRLLGAIGILEDTAPKRFESTVSLMRKLNLPEKVLRYHEVHISCDCRHGEDILEHVLMPAVMAGNEYFLKEVCMGVLIRLHVAIDYYKAIKDTFEFLFKTGDIKYAK